jgi:hypothetical protein
MKRWLLLLVGAAFVGLLVAVEMLRPRPYDERLRLEHAGTEPFDAEVFYRLLPAWLGAPVEVVDAPPFLFLADTTLAGTAYVFLTDDLAPDDDEADRLLAYVARGNTLLIATENVEGALADRFEADSLDGFWLEWRPARSDDPAVNPFDMSPLSLTDTLTLAHPRLARPGGYAFPAALGGMYAEGFDAARVEVLGRYATGEPTLLRLRHGRGSLLLSSTPISFSNAALAGDGDGAAYLTGLLRHVPPVERVYWDAHYKPLRAQLASRLAVVARTPALRGAVTLVLLGAVLFVLFRGRRRQRPIPVVEPPENAERAFARTVGRLHLLQGDRGWLARRRALAFEDALRTRLGLADADLSDETAARAAARAGRPLDETRALFQRLRNLRADPRPEPERLIEADRAVDAFFAARAPDEADRASPVASRSFAGPPDA